MNNCVKCSKVIQGAYRPVMGRGRLERLCPACAETLSALVQAAGETCRLSLADERFVVWLASGRWSTRDGRSLGPEDLPHGWHGAECPCCATFAEE